MCLSINPNPLLLSAFDSDQINLFLCARMLLSDRHVKCHQLCTVKDCLLCKFIFHHCVNKARRANHAGIRLFGDGNLEIRHSVAKKDTNSHEEWPSELF